jgi:integrase
LNNTLDKSKKLITLSKRFKTSDEGIFYKKIVSEEKLLQYMNKNNISNIKSLSLEDMDSLKQVDKLFIVRYRDSSNKDKLITIGKYTAGITQAYCKQKRNEILNKERLGEDIQIKHKKKERKTLDNLADIYFNDKKIDKYRQNRYNNHIKPVFGNKDITTIKKADIQKFLNNLTDSGQAPASVNAVRELLTATFNHSIKEHELKLTNPCIGIKRLKTDNERERYLTTDEVNILLDKLKDNKPIWLVVKLSLSTGARIMSVIDIQKKDIDLVHGTVTIKNFKTNSTYTGFLQKDLIEFLKEYLKDFKLNDYVVSIDNGNKPTFKNIQWRLKPLLDKLFNTELKADDRKNRVVIHSLRHTFASHLAINGTPIFTIQKLMDHAKIEQTLRYAKLAPDSGKINVEGLYR